MNWDGRVIPTRASRLRMRISTVSTVTNPSSFILSVRIRIAISNDAILSAAGNRRDHAGGAINAPYQPIDFVGDEDIASRIGSDRSWIVETGLYCGTAIAGVVRESIARYGRNVAFHNKGANAIAIHKGQASRRRKTDGLGTRKRRRG